MVKVGIRTTAATRRTLNALCRKHNMTQEKMFESFIKVAKEYPQLIEKYETH